MELPSSKRRWKGVQIDYDLLAATADDLRCIRLSDRDRLILLALTEQASWRTRYYSPTGQEIIKDTLQEWAATTEQRLMADGGCEGSEGQCTVYMPNDPLISYAPNDPFVTPDYVAPGFLLPAWYDVDTPPLPGSSQQIGDVFTDVTRIISNPFAPGNWLPPPFNTLLDLLNAGFPRFRIQWTSAGDTEIEVHLLGFPGAGMAVVAVDDDVNQVFVENLAEDITDYSTWFDLITAGVHAVHIVELQIAGAGTHHVDVTMIPYVTEDPPFAHFGGGFRQIVLCGEGIEGIMPQPIFRFTAECGLEFSVNAGASWQSVAGWDTYAPTCFAGPPGADGAPGEQGPPGATRCRRCSR